VYGHVVYTQKNCGGIKQRLFVYKNFKNKIMKTLLNFTPRLVMAVMLITLFCPALLAKGTTAAATVPAENAVEVIAGFIVLVGVILLPLTKKKNNPVAK
jgi:hypothetical protein